MMEVNGKRSSGKRSWALNINYFLMTDKVEKENVQIKCCTRDKMWGYFMTQQIRGGKFRTFRKYLLGGNEYC